MTVFVAEFTALEKEQPLYFFLLRRRNKEKKEKSESERKEIIKFGTKKVSDRNFLPKKRFFDRPEKKFRTLEPKTPLVPSTEAAEGAAAAALTLMSLSYKSHFRD